MINGEIQALLEECITALEMKREKERNDFVQAFSVEEVIELEEEFDRKLSERFAKDKEKIEGIHERIFTNFNILVPTELWERIRNIEEAEGVYRKVSFLQAQVIKL